ncbi:hypothetical protein [Zavarzinia sp.]|uniref:hypothetical protein n=1 Tax=Zavarzinia sp. TaxID=2027920 RepID=UPI003BB64DAC
MDGSSLVTVNLDEMCRILEISAPTFRGWLKTYPDLPVVGRGDRGRAWEFDPHAVKAWRERKRQEEAEAAAAKLDLVDQLSLPGMGEAAADAILSPAQQYQLIRAKREQRKMDQEAGLLVMAEPLRAALGDVFAQIPAAMRGAISDAFRRHAIPDDVRRAVTASVDERWTTAVRGLQQVMGGRS